MRETIDLRYRGASYSFGVSQTGPGHYQLEVDGARVEVDIERISEHESRVAYGGRSYRTVTALQDADLLVEVNGVPHRVSRDEGGLVRATRPRSSSRSPSRRATRSRPAMWSRSRRA